MNFSTRRSPDYTYSVRAWRRYVIKRVEGLIYMPPLLLEAFVDLRNANDQSIDKAADRFHDVLMAY